MDIYKNPTTDIKLNGQKTKCIPLKIRNEPRMFALMISIQFCPKGLISVIRQEKEMQGIRIRREEVKLSLFAYMTFYPENLMGSTPQKVLELTTEFSKGARYKITIQKFTMF